MFKLKMAVLALCISYCRKQDVSRSSSDSDEGMPLAVLLHRQFQSKMGRKTMDQGASTSREAHTSDLLIIQGLLEDMVNRATGIVDGNNEGMDVGNPKLPREDKTIVIKKRAPKRVNKAKERKSLLNLGEEYINKTGNTVAAKSLGIGCSKDICKRRCKLKMNEEQRMVILRAYWGLGQPRMRWDYIAKTVKVVATKFRRTDTRRPKESSRIYTSVTKK